MVAAPGRATSPFAVRSSSTCTSPVTWRLRPTIVSRSMCASMRTWRLSSSRSPVITSPALLTGSKPMASRISWLVSGPHVEVPEPVPRRRSPMVGVSAPMPIFCSMLRITSVWTECDRAVTSWPTKAPAL